MRCLKLKHDDENRRINIMRQIHWLLCFLLLIPGVAAWGNNLPASLRSVYASTAENDSLHGDSIYIRFQQPITAPNWVDPRIVSSVAIPGAPAGDLGGNALAAINAAKNYQVKITPEVGSTTQPFTGTWHQLGGKAIYDPNDPEYKTVILVLTSPQNIFKPGDKIELTFLTDLVGRQGQSLQLKNQTLLYYAS